MAQTNETVVLDYPITVDGTKVEKLSIRRLTVGDMLSAKNDSKTDAETEIRLVANLAMIAYEDALKLDAADYTKVQSVLKYFQQPGKSKK